MTLCSLLLVFHLMPKHTYKNHWSLVLYEKSPRFPTYLLGAEQYFSHRTTEKRSNICSPSACQKPSISGPYLLEFGLVVLVSDHEC